MDEKLHGHQLATAFSARIRATSERKRRFFALAPINGFYTLRVVKGGSVGSASTLLSQVRFDDRLKPRQIKKVEDHETAKLKEKLARAHDKHIADKRAELTKAKNKKSAAAIESELMQESRRLKKEQAREVSENVDALRFNRDGQIAFGLCYLGGADRKTLFLQCRKKPTAMQARQLRLYLRHYKAPIPWSHIELRDLQAEDPGDVGLDDERDPAELSLDGLGEPEEGEETPAVLNDDDEEQVLYEGSNYSGSADEDDSEEDEIVGALTADAEDKESDAETPSMAAADAPTMPDETTVLADLVRKAEALNLISPDDPAPNPSWMHKTMASGDEARREKMALVVNRNWQEGQDPGLLRSMIGLPSALPIDLYCRKEAERLDAAVAGAEREAVAWYAATIMLVAAGLDEDEAIDDDAEEEEQEEEAGTGGFKPDRLQSLISALRGLSLSDKLATVPSVKTGMQATALESVMAQARSDAEQWRNQSEMLAQMELVSSATNASLQDLKNIGGAIAGIEKHIANFSGRHQAH